MAREELAAWLRLSVCPGVGNSGARKLLAALGLPQAIFEAGLPVLQQLVSAKQAQAVHTLPPKFSDLWARTQAWLDGAEMDAPSGAVRQIVTLGDPGYPTALLQMEDPPLLLYVLGSSASGGLGALDMNRCIAMVGSRNPTPQGAGNARQFAKSLALAGLTVVSGLALGVDGAAHEGALEASQANVLNPLAPLRTVAFVGTGLDRVYPKQHRELAHRIAAQGLLISEYPLGTPPLAENFPRRNRLIAGLSRATLVVEAALQSGSLITARLASEQGKDVFAIPGSIHSAQSRGCHALIKQGAKLVESAVDVLEEFGVEVAAQSVTGEDAIKKIAKNDRVPSAGGQNDATTSLLQALGFDLVSLDALQARTGLPTAALQAQLLELELNGQVARLPGGLFQRIGAA